MLEGVLKRLLNKIRLIIVKWLGVTAELDELKRQIDVLTRNQFETEAKMKIVWTLTKVDVDISPSAMRDDLGRGHEQSWAVICLHGEKRNFMQFVNLENSKMREIQEFLRHFEQRNIHLDLPFSMKRSDFFRY